MLVPHVPSILLCGLRNATFYLDNIFVFGDTFEAHLDAINSVLVRLKLHGLTVGPSKSCFGFPTINDHEFVDGNGGVKPQ